MAINTIKINVPEEDRDALLLEVLWVIKNIREKKEAWETHYGSTHRKALKTWEERADKILVQLKIPVNYVIE